LKAAVFRGEHDTITAPATISINSFNLVFMVILICYYTFIYHTRNTPGLLLLPSVECVPDIIEAAVLLNIPPKIAIRK
jgi:hypothetical protein